MHNRRRRRSVSQLHTSFSRVTVIFPGGFRLRFRGSRLHKLIGPLRFLNNLCRLCWEPLRHRDQASCIRDKTSAMYSLAICAHTQAWPSTRKNHVCTRAFQKYALINNNWRKTKFCECRRKNYHLFRLLLRSKTSTQATRIRVSSNQTHAVLFNVCYCFLALYLSCFIGTYRNCYTRFSINPILQARCFSSMRVQKVSWNCINEMVSDEWFW